MAFVKTRCGRWANIAHVREVRRSEDGSHATLRLEGGVERCVDWDEFAMATWTTEMRVVPALPGTYRLHTADDGTQIGREPVIAWAVGAGGCVRPIGARGGHFETIDYSLIEHPDKIVEARSGIYETYETWQAEFRAELAKSVLKEAGPRGQPN